MSETPLYSDYLALQSENAKLKADIAAKDAALSNTLDWIRSNTTKPVHDLLRYCESALSPNPPVYVPGEIVEKLVDALELLRTRIWHKPWCAEEKGTGFCDCGMAPAFGTIVSALALALPFITKGDSK